ncbi:hypothetical protein EMIHUDRAFT_225573 [Emiliania huxleyi CCMP1516]|uniref:ADP ribosyltransferase domain-containing protein n=2 Tax=Emiliania huxleyi TaxID=2903 RepID=A0A0D3KNR7_EMIH1|nr:hypothetical protein EMIHUDRAFT_225573 [Emiliania huxleyi CCMP1516]EOD37402.1 hypothetical protein EMIHUDRAFT_225573 [Emiliania huxleyi CCMP1516]|eukprot:XP_005789831.1 hypothetical protein EMIHUDRAFT_225573 [Emiliania huxleyi CCMP1516]
MRTGSPALREHLTKLNTSVRFLGAIAERATQALSTQALHKFERGVGWLMVLPSALCIGAVELSRNMTIDDASLAPGHKLGQTVNFLVVAVAVAPVLASFLVSSVLVRVPLSVLGRDEGVAMAALLHEEPPLITGKSSSLDSILALVGVGSRRGSASVAVMKRACMAERLSTSSHPDEMLQWALLLAYACQITHVLSGQSELENDATFAVILLIGFPALVYAARQLRNLRIRIATQHNAADLLERFHARMRHLVLLQLCCVCLVLVTAVSSPLLLPPVAYSSDANPCTLVTRWFLWTKCRRSHALTGSPYTCSADGYGPYSSAYAACSAARSQLPFLAVTYSAIMLSLNALLYLWLLTATDDAAPPPSPPPAEWRGLEAFWLGAWLFTTIAIGCSPLYVAALLADRGGYEHMPSPTTFEALARLRVQTVNILCWCTAMLLFNTPRVRHAYQVVKLSRCLGCSREVAGTLAAIVSGEPATTYSKYAEPTTLAFAPLGVAARGVEAFLAGDGLMEDSIRSQMARGGVEAIRREFEASGSEADVECMRYVLDEEAGSSPTIFPNAPFPRDCDWTMRARADRTDPLSGRGLRLCHFVEHPSARLAGLSSAHVAALRIYTTAAFRSINEPLRDHSRVAAKKPHPLPVTVALIADAVRRLRAAAPDADVPLDLYRGLKNVQVGDASSSFVGRGGTERAPMSTTSDVRVAVRYAASEHSVLLRLRTKNAMERGADLAWLSAFPGEHEFLFPPLTFLQHVAMDTVDIGGRPFRVLEMEPRLG